MMPGHHLCRRASHPHPRRLQHGLSDFCHGLLDYIPLTVSSPGRKNTVLAGQGDRCRARYRSLPPIGSQDTFRLVPGKTRSVCLEGLTDGKR